jgi:hypothetical protein
MPPFITAVAIQLNQGTMKGTGCFAPFLNFPWILSIFQEKESDKRQLKRIEIK